MKNNHKKLIASIALVGTMAAGGTFALLQTTTGTATNNFTSTKNIKGVLYEDKFEGTNVNSTRQDLDDGVNHIVGGTWEGYLPTQTQAKDPTIKILDTSVPAYVGMKVTFKIDDKVVSKTEFEKRLAHVDGINTNWTEIGDKTDNTYFYSYNAVVTNGAETSPLFNSVTINKTIYSDEAQTNEVTDQLPSFEIKAEGYAVQAEGTTKSHDGDLLALAKVK